MKHIVACADGTWMAADAPNPTNVRLTFDMLNREGAPLTPPGQALLYDPGVGTGRYDKVRGGVWGLGLLKNVQEIAEWCLKHYVEGAFIWLFGYSRGAFTARSVAGRLGRHDVPVHFVGVWDTVGRLGIPGMTAWRYRDAWEDTVLGAHIKHARHVMAIDERRRLFAPTLWTRVPGDGQTCTQIWFPGVHSDVGGGGESRALSDYPLRWMLREAALCGLPTRWAGIAEPPVPVAQCRIGESLSLPHRMMVPKQRDIHVPGTLISRLAYELEEQTAYTLP